MTKVITSLWNSIIVEKIVLYFFIYTSVVPNFSLNGWKMLIKCISLSLCLFKRQLESTRKLKFFFMTNQLYVYVKIFSILLFLILEQSFLH